MSLEALLKPVSISKPNRRLSNSEFEAYRESAKAIGTWDNLEKTWKVYPVVLLDPESRKHVEKLVELGAPGALELKKLAEDVEKAFGENDVLGFFPSDDPSNVVLVFKKPEVYEKFVNEFARLDWKEGGLTIYRKVFDNVKRRFEVKEIPFYKATRMSVIIPRGLVPRVMKFIRGNNLKSNLETLRYYSGTLDLTGVTVPLRDYQQRAVKSILSQLEWIGAATLMASTGSGKTEMGIAVVQALKPTPSSPVLVIVPSKDLVIQWVERFKRYGFTDNDIAYVTGDSKHTPPGYRVLVTTYATAHKASEELKAGMSTRSEEPVPVDSESPEEVEEPPGETSEVVKVLQNAKAIVIDEAHHIPARTVRNIFTVAKTPLRIALSATPWRNDELDLFIYAYAGEIADKVTSSELIDKGFLVPAIIFRVPTGVKGSFKNYQSEASNVIKNQDRINLTVEIVKVLPKPTLVLAALKEPGELLTNALKNAGIDAEFVSGELSTEERINILNKVRRGEIQVLVATTLADEGLDIPELRSLVLYYGGKSKTKIFQRIGRVLRPAPGKSAGIVVDLVDGTEYLGKHAEERKAMYMTEPRWVVIDTSDIDDFKQKLIEATGRYEESYKKKLEEQRRILQEFERKGWKILDTKEANKISIVLPDINVSLKQPVAKKTWSFGAYDVVAYASGSEKDMVWVFQRKRRPTLAPTPA